MGESTAISWTDSTWNPWMGCKKVSPGCDHCYAERDMTRYGRDFNTVSRTSDKTFYAPLHWKEPRRIFTCSWSDFFMREADAFRMDAWEVIRHTPWHTYQILTKRPGLAVAWYKEHGWLENVWLGTSVESAKYLPRLSVLARVPAKVRFVSCEPLLEPLDLRPYLHLVAPLPGSSTQFKPFRLCDWVIAGGESGPGYRPLKLEWVRSLQNQCQTAGVPFFFKQGSGLRPGGDWLLDGRTWKETP